MTDTRRDSRPAAEDSSPGTKYSRREQLYTAAVVVAAAGAACITGYLFLVPSAPLTVGFLVMFLMMALMLIRVPIAVAMMASASLGLYVLSSQRALEGSLREIVFPSFASWSLSVIPMFILMGVALGKSGLVSGAYEAARRWLGWMPGGLAVSTTMSGAAMAATSGSTIGITFALGRTTIPELIGAGYRPSLAMGSVAMAGSLGQVIPPSVLLVIYASVAQTPVGPQLVAGVVPGIILALMFATVIILWAVVSPGAAPRGPSYPMRERIASLVHLIPILVVVTVVLGGIYGGVFTATEAGAFGAAVVLVMGLAVLVFKSRRARAAGGQVKTGAVLTEFISSTLLQTVSAVGSIFFLLIGVNLLLRVMTLSGFAHWVAEGVIGLGLSKLTFLLMLIPVYLILGFFLDTLAMMLLTIPVFMAPLEALDVNLLWFGIFLIILAEIDMVAPPLGILNFVILQISRQATEGMGVKLTIGDVFKGVMPFIGACIVMLVLLVAVPELATWLPSLSSAK